MVGILGGEIGGFHGIFFEVVEFPGGLLFVIDGVDFVGPIGESGVAFLMGFFGVSGEFFDVFEEAFGEGSLLARLLRFHELFDEAVAEGGLAVGEKVPEGEWFEADGLFPFDEGGEVDAIEDGLVLDGGFTEGEESGVDVR